MQKHPRDMAIEDGTRGQRRKEELYTRLPRGSQKCTTRKKGRAFPSRKSALRAGLPQVRRFFVQVVISSLGLGLTSGSPRLLTGHGVATRLPC